MPSRIAPLEAYIGYIASMLPSIEQKHHSRRREHASTLSVATLASIIRSLVDKKENKFNYRIVFRGKCACAVMLTKFRDRFH